MWTWGKVEDEVVADMRVPQVSDRGGMGERSVARLRWVACYWTGSAERESRVGSPRGKAGQAVLVTRSWDELGWKGPQRARPAETERAGHGKKAKKGRERVSSSFF